MNANSDSKYRLPRWGVVLVSSALALAVVGSGIGNASASTGGQGGRSGAQVGDRITPADTTQRFQDVPSTSPFFSYINNVYLEGLVNGYPCGAANEPCVAPGNLPYYRPGTNLTRAQMAKITNTAQDMTVHDLTVPFRVVNTTPAGVGVWGGNSGSGPIRDPNNINAGLYGDATGNSNSVGLLSVSEHDSGAWIQSDSSNFYSLYIPHNGADIEQGNSGPTDALKVVGHVTIVGGCTGCTTGIVMMNTGTTDLHPGEVVSFGSAAPVGTSVDGNTVAGASPSSVEYDTAVAGVVVARYVPGDPDAPVGTAEHTGGQDNSATAIKPGEFMTVVTDGAVNMVKVEAGAKGIHAGDILTTSGTAGVAMQATDKLSSIGSTIGKAMGSLNSGTGYIPVLVTLK